MRFVKGALITGALARTINLVPSDTCSISCDTTSDLITAARCVATTIAQGCSYELAVTEVVSATGDITSASCNVGTLAWLQPQDIEDFATTAALKLSSITLISSADISSASVSMHYVPSGSWDATSCSPSTSASDVAEVTLAKSCSGTKCELTNLQDSSGNSIGHLISGDYYYISVYNGDTAVTIDSAEIKYSGSSSGSSDDGALGSFAVVGVLSLLGLAAL